MKILCGPLDFSGALRLCGDDEPVVALLPSARPRPGGHTVRGCALWLALRPHLVASEVWAQQEVLDKYSLVDSVRLSFRSPFPFLASTPLLK